MLRGLVSAAAGMMGRIQQQDAIANNLANVNTSGYKRKVVAFSAFDAALRKAGELPQSDSAKLLTPRPTEFEDKSEGAIHTTGVATDFAIDGPGYFVLQTSGGEKLVRDGSFQLDSTGRLISSDGSLVMGEKGAIQITDQNWFVDPDGTIHSGSAVVDRLRIEGRSDGSNSSKQTRIASGCLESSNVNSVSEMVSMITGFRSYEACQKTIQSLDQTLDKVINQLGRG